MTVKEKVGRPRYVAFRVEGDAARSAITKAIQRAGAATVGQARADQWRLTVLEAGMGFLRVPHPDKDPAIAAIASVRDPAALTPLGTSGTLRAAKRKFTPAHARNSDRSGPSPPN